MEQETTNTNDKTEQILKQLERIETEVVKTQKALTKLKKYMFWRFLVFLLAIILPVLALPYFISVFYESYVTGLQGLL
jgi:hypothetical protein